MCFTFSIPKFEKLDIQEMYLLLQNNLLIRKNATNYLIQNYANVFYGRCILYCTMNKNEKIQNNNTPLFFSYVCVRIGVHILM